MVEYARPTSGTDAAAAAELLATAPIGSREVGSVIYTALCNARGGVQADLTITRDAPDQFYVSSGGSTATQVMLCVQYERLLREGQRCCCVNT